MTLLTSCAKETFSGPVLVPETVIVQKCPILKDYSKEFQNEVADELEKLPEDSKVLQMMGDYGNLRKACRTLK